MSFDSATWDATEFDSLLKDYYLGPTQDLLNNKTVLLRRLARNEEDFGGRQIITPLRVSRNEGIGGIGKGGSLPDPGQQGYRNLAFGFQMFYGRAMLPGPDMAQARSDKFAFMRLMEGELSNLVVDVKHEFNRIVHGDGSGVLAQQVGALAGDVVTVDNPGGFANPGNGTLYIRPGMTLVGVDSSGASTGNTSAKVLSVDAAAETVTFATTPTGWANNDFLVRTSRDQIAAPPAIDHGWDNEPFGLAAIISDADPQSRSLQGLAVASNDFWKATVNSNSGVARSLSLDLLQQVEDQLDIDADAMASLIHSDHFQRRRYLDLLESSKRFVNRLTLDGGFKALEYNEVPWSVDKDCTPGRIYFVDEEPINIFQMSDFFFLDKDGSILHRGDDRDLYQLTLAWYGEIGTQNRKRGAVILDLVAA